MSAEAHGPRDHQQHGGAELGGNAKPDVGAPLGKLGHLVRRPRARRPYPASTTA
jgi:hypothetical protein